MNFELFTHDDLLEYDFDTVYENRQYIIIKNVDFFTRYLIGIICKKDDKNNLLVRYLDNPTNRKQWWYGLEEPGLDPTIYNKTAMNNLIDNDFSSGGYDDIININDSNIFQILECFPFYSGRYGNVYTNMYYNELYATNEKFFNIKSTYIPDELYQVLGTDSFKRKPITFVDILSNKYKRHANLTEKEVKRLLSYKINNTTKIIMHRDYDIVLEDIERIKLEWKNDYYPTFTMMQYLKIISILENIDFIMYDYSDYCLQFDNLFTIEKNEKTTKINLYKIKEHLFILYDDTHDCEAKT